MSTNNPTYPAFVYPIFNVSNFPKKTVLYHNDLNGLNKDDMKHLSVEQFNNATTYATNVNPGIISPIDYTKFSNGVNLTTINQTITDLQNQILNLSMQINNRTNNIKTTITKDTDITIGTIKVRYDYTNYRIVIYGTQKISIMYQYHLRNYGGQSIDGSGGANTVPLTTIMKDTNVRINPGFNNNSSTTVMIIDKTNNGVYKIEFFGASIENIYISIEKLF